MSDGKLFKYELGSMATDRITGFSGIITGRTEWLNGCKRYGLQPKELKDGKTIEAEWFDEQQLHVHEEGGFTATQAAVGGPMPDPRF